MTAATANHTAELIAAECIAVRIRVLNRTITGLFDDALRPLGLTAGQLGMLVLIATRGPMSASEVSSRLNMEKSTVSRNVERMRSKRWLTSAPSRESSKTKLLRLTAKGERLLGQVEPYWRDAQDRSEAILGRRGARSIHHVGNVVMSKLTVS